MSKSQNSKFTVPFLLERETKGAVRYMEVLIAWVMVTAAVLWWPTHQLGFDARWVAMPPAMSWETIDRARKASALPSFCMWEMFDYPGGGCRVG